MFTTANPPVSSESSRRLSCDSWISRRNDDWPMPSVVSSGNDCTSIASSPIVVSPRGSMP